MDTKTLRKKILELAIHGKLVPQDPSDEPASVLLERIRAEKERLVKEGKIKKNKKTIASDKSPYQNNEPWELPKGWCWTTLDSIGTTELGKTLDKEKNKGEYYPYLCSINVLWGNFDFSVVKEMRFEREELERYKIQNNDLLICEGGDAGRCSVWTNNNEIYYQNALHRVRFYEKINPYFFMYYIWYLKDIQKLDKYTKGVTIKHFTKTALCSLPLILPPISEQNRIVSGIEKWLKVIDNLDWTKDSLENTLILTKSKILDLAITGKLVSQDPSDEPAIEVLKRINPSFTPCDNSHYPNSWSCVRMKSTVNIINGKSQKDVESPSGKYPIYGSGGKIGYSNQYSCLAGSTIIGRKGTIDNPIFINENFWNIDTAFGMKPMKPLDDLFFFYFCCMFDFKKMDRSTALPSLTKTGIGNIIVPIPPLNEQNRIVSKIEELFFHIDTIAYILKT